MADQVSEGILSAFLRNQRIKAAEPYMHGRVLDVGSGSGKLSEYISQDLYLGVESDQTSLGIARSLYPAYHFQNTLPDEAEKFDTIIALAVIEHIKRPEEFIATLSMRLSSAVTAHVVLTTPYPSMDRIHYIGAKAGLFSKHANKEHEDLLNRDKLESLGKYAGLQLSFYRRFLLGANQLAIFSR